MPDAAARPSPAADGELVARAAAGDERAIGQLYDRYGAVLFEAFGQAGRGAPRFEAGRGSVAGWLTTIARSRALDLVRARSRRDRLTATAAADRPGTSPAMGDFRPDPAGALDNDERRRQVRQALETLSAPQRQAIELAYFEGLSQSEIAERLQEPLGTVKTRVRLGMQKLRECL